MPTVKINQQKLYYESIGAGDPLLLMHGWMQTGRQLMPLAKHFATQYRVIVPDMPGYGRSVPPTRAFPPDFYQRDAEIIAGFLKSLRPAARLNAC